MKRLLFSFIGILVFCGNVVLEARTPGSGGCAGNLETVTGAPSETLLHLLRLSGLKHSKSWEGIIKSTTTWRISEEEKINGNLPSSGDIKDLHLFYNDLSLLNMTQIEAPARAQYDYAVIPGAILSVMRQRLRFLITEWERGVRINHIVFVTRARQLYRVSEEPEHFVNPKYNHHPVKDGWDKDRDSVAIENENDIAPFIWGQMKLPKEWIDGTVKVSFITADDCKIADSSCKFEAFKKWLKTNNMGKRSSVLFISSQPFIPLDECRILKVFRGDRKIDYDIAGPGFALVTLEQPWGVGVCLDVLASWIDEAKGKGCICSFF